MTQEEIIKHLTSLQKKLLLIKHFKFSLLLYIPITLAVTGEDNQAPDQKAGPHQEGPRPYPERRHREGIMTLTF